MRFIFSFSLALLCSLSHANLVVVPAGDLTPEDRALAPSVSASSAVPASSPPGSPSDASVFSNASHSKSEKPLRETPVHKCPSFLGSSIKCMR